MNTIIQRKKYNQLKEELTFFPVVAILGPRQCGKSTLAKELLRDYPNSVYLDLELPSDINKLDNPELFFDINSDKLICIDEIQRAPEIFSLMRAMIDKDRRPGRFLILGSASKLLIKQSSETLAGRIGYTELTPFALSEVSQIEGYFQKLWFRGGFPEAFLAKKELFLQRWLENYIITYVERDIPALGIALSPEKMLRFISFLAQLNGQTVNWSKLADFLEISSPSVKKYVEIIEGTFLIRLLSPYKKNKKKRMVKSPKIYFRDTGLLHSLLKIESMNNLMGAIALGESWEGYAIEQIISVLHRWETSYYRTSNGAEIDLILEKGERRIAVECKVSRSPKVTKGFFTALEDIGITDAWIICPIDDFYEWRPGVKIGGLEPFLEYINDNFQS